MYHRITRAELATFIQDNSRCIDQIEKILAGKKLPPCVVRVLEAEVAKKKGLVKCMSTKMCKLVEVEDVKE